MGHGRDEDPRRSEVPGVAWSADEHGPAIPRQRDRYSLLRVVFRPAGNRGLPVGGYGDCIALLNAAAATAVDRAGADQLVAQLGVLRGGRLRCAKRGENPTV